MVKKAIKRGFADTSQGQIHYAMAGTGRPVLLLHQTPRSWDEYRDVLPILGEKYWAIAMDTIGFGDSYKPEKESSIEEYARGVISFLDALSIEHASIVGHHTGGVIAVEVAASYPERVHKLILSGTPYLDAKERDRRKEWPPLDEVQLKEDGSHLKELWQRRLSYYPKHRPDLLTRLVIDALKAAGRMGEEAHQAVYSYRMEDKVGLIKAQSLVLAGAEDQFGFPYIEALSKNIKGSETAVLEGGMLPTVDQMPEEFARVVIDFLDKT
jgi:pimeloyl-ACP methyl ester carboxylesterase